MSSVIDSVLSAVTARWSNRQRQRELTFGEAVRAICDGEEPTPDRLEKMLLECGKTPADLAAAVAFLQERRRHAANIRRTAELEAERATLHAAIEGLEAAHAAALAAHRQRVAVPLQRLEAIRGEIRAMGGDPAVALRASAPQELRAEYADVGGKLEQLAASRKEQARERDRLAALGKAEAAARAEQALAGIDAERAALEARQAELQAAMMRP